MIFALRIDGFPILQKSKIRSQAEEDSLKYKDLQEEATGQYSLREHRYRDGPRGFGRCECDIGYYSGILCVLGVNDESYGVCDEQCMAVLQFSMS